MLSLRTSPGGKVRLSGADGAVQKYEDRYIFHLNLNVLCYILC